MDFAMNGMEWVELENLAAGITTLRSRLVQARSRKDHRLGRSLEEEILAAERRRERLTAHITTQVADAPHSRTQSASIDHVARPGEPDAATPPSSEAAAPKPPPAASVDPVASQPAGITSAPEADTVKGGVVVWDQLTPGDIERARDELGVRRAEMLARHAEELKGLHAAQAELDTLERAIEAFTRKFKLPAGESGVAQVGEQSESRQQAAGQA